MAVTDGCFCWSSASEAESSSVASPVCPSAFDDFNGDCWPSESPDLPQVARLFIIFGFRASIRNIWIRKGSLEDELGHAGWQWLLCKGQTQSLKFVHSSVTARWRIVAVSSGLKHSPLDHCNWRVQSDSDGAAWSFPLFRPSPLFRKKNVRKHQSYAKRCILRASRQKAASFIIAGIRTDQPVRYHMPNGSSVAPKDRYMQWAGIWRKQV